MQAGDTVAGKYRLNRLLGTGGMASVWSATNVFTEREFAVKFMLPQVARTPEAARRFLLEAKVSARINHPNIIEVIDVGQTEDSALFLVMELLTGMSLDVGVRRRTPPMTVHEFIGHMKDVTDALAAAHRSGVIHRDLKPTNIFLHTDRDGRVVPKLLDFGVSKILEEENNTSLTVVGTVLGSPLYMSPEQAMGAEGIDGRTDVFAFGGILFESLTGQRTYDAPNFNALIVSIATKQPKSIDVVAPELPEPLRALVRECLVTDKTKRLGTFELVSERLAAMLPELIKADILLPGPYGIERSSDPDATNLLPLVRSESSGAGPPPETPGSEPPPAPTQPLLITSAPVSANGPKSTDGVVTWLRGVDRYVKSLPPRAQALAIGGAGMAILVALLIGVAAAFSGSGPKSQAAILGSGVAAATGTTAVPAVDPPKLDPSNIPSADDSTDVPVISVDSLPVAGRGAPSKGNGRLAIRANPGWCSISVDGAQRGVTPLVFELPAGAHRVDCTSPAGKTLTTNVSIAEGTASQYHFALEE